MSPLLIWIIWSLGAVTGMILVTWYFAMRRGRLLWLFYAAFVPIVAAWKLYLTYTGKNFDCYLLVMLFLLIGGTWALCRERWGRVLSAFAVLAVANAGSEFIALGLMEDILGIAVVPLWESQGALCCILLANGLCFLFLLAVSGIWRHSEQKKWVKRAFLLFFFLVVQNVLLLWLIYASFLNYIRITVWMLAGAGILVFGSFYFVKVQLHYEETKEMEARIRKLELESQKEYDRYRQLEEKEKLLCQIRHDFNNHLATAYYLAQEGQMEQAELLLAEMEQEMGEEDLGFSGKQTEMVKTGMPAAPEAYWEERECTGKGMRVLRTGLRLLSLPVGQFLLAPKMLHVFFEHKGTWLAHIGMVIVLFLLATDAVWLFLLIGQRKREDLNDRFLEFQYMAHLTESREQAAQERAQEVQALQKELLDCLGQARKMMQEGQAPEVFRGILLKVQEKEHVRYCANELVNTVLEEKRQYCRQFGIRFLAETEIPGETAIKSSHLCSVFTNLLDNAVQACQNMPAENRWILVQSRRKEDYLYIRVSNPTSREYEQRPRESGHGLGKTILARIAAAYQGECWTRLEQIGQEEIYTAAVVLQLAGQKAKL